MRAQIVCVISCIIIITYATEPLVHRQPESHPMTYVWIQSLAGGPRTCTVHMTALCFPKSKSQRLWLNYSVRIVQRTSESMAALSLSLLNFVVLCENAPKFIATRRTGWLCAYSLGAGKRKNACMNAITSEARQASRMLMNLRRQLADGRTRI